jgi:outer membrane protein OmpA-like peptidoglycan-associated protein
MNLSCLLRWFGYLAAMMIAAGAHAQDRFDIEALDTVTSSEGSVLNVFGGRTLPQGSFAVSLQGSYGRKPLSIETDSGESLGDLVGSIGTLQLIGAMGVYKQLEIGLGIPVHRVSAGSSFETTPPLNVQSAAMRQSKVAFGDIRIVPRASLYQHDGSAGFDLALLASVWVPTGNNDYYAGESVRVEPRVAIDYATRSWLVAFNAGYMVRSEANFLGSVMDDQVRLGLGATVDLGKHFTLLGEVDTHLNVLSNDFGSDDVASEAFAGLRYSAGGLVAQVAGGPGIVRGLSTPMYRMLASIEVGGAIKQPVEEHESVLDYFDHCAPLPDGTTNPEDRTGCPDVDTDHDGLADGVDACPKDPEDKDGFQDDDGCPELDNDGDGVLDVNDTCPNEAEDRDGFQDEDGCPDPDNDQDSIPDVDDQCPLVAGVLELHGCPLPKRVALVVVTKEKIELKETVLFGFNNAEILPGSFPLMDAIAEVLAEHLEIEIVVVEGHTDSVGAKAFNQKLSERRAASVVVALVSRGVAPSRLSSKGYGLTHPLLPNDSDENRAKNRRVELRIDRRTPEAPVVVPVLVR